MRTEDEKRLYEKALSCIREQANLSDEPVSTVLTNKGYILIGSLETSIKTKSPNGTNYIKNEGKWITGFKSPVDISDIEEIQNNTSPSIIARYLLVRKAIALNVSAYAFSFGISENNNYTFNQEVYCADIMKYNPKLQDLVIAAAILCDLIVPEGKNIPKDKVLQLFSKALPHISKIK